MDTYLVFLIGEQGCVSDVMPIKSKPYMHGFQRVSLPLSRMYVIGGKWWVIMGASES